MSKSISHVELAGETIRTYIKTGKAVKVPSDLSDELKGRAGVFVSIKKFGELRGCIGTFEPTRENIAQEIIQNAISASTRDPRFPAVSKDELSDLTLSVDVLSSPEPVSSADELDPKRYGVIVQSGWKRGLLLPDLEGVDTVEQQVLIAKRKAGIADEEEVDLYRFEVKRHK
ncbi:MAG: AmmeMemoRadiSam system protein A [Proteobacteria bacterium]|nr:AmmeMemoRadiSam system protein A [Pseudomonadota bacterium]